MPQRMMSLCCPRCQRSFNTDERYLDLTLTSGVQQQAYKQTSWAGTEIFRRPQVSFAYERGWRQGFVWAGFPGVDKEYEIAMDYLRPAYGQVLLDMSCGSGLFSRRFARSGRFSGVVAADFSESMLAQAKEYFQQELRATARTPTLLLRADVGRLPFLTASLAAVHAGAALHCWPNPQLAVAELSRVLRPGGVLVASTFLTPTAPLGEVLGDQLAMQIGKLPGASLMAGGSTYRQWEEVELRDLCNAAGLVNFRRIRTFRFILFAADKPGTPPAPPSAAANTVLAYA